MIPHRDNLPDLEQAATEMVGAFRQLSIAVGDLHLAAALQTIDVGTDIQDLEAKGGQTASPAVRDYVLAQLEDLAGMLSDSETTVGDTVRTIVQRCRILSDVHSPALRAQNVDQPRDSSD